MRLFIWDWVEIGWC